MSPISPADHETHQSAPRRPKNPLNSRAYREAQRLIRGRAGLRGSTAAALPVYCAPLRNERKLQALCIEKLVQHPRVDCTTPDARAVHAPDPRAKDHFLES
jgi:hypothetical protein